MADAHEQSPPSAGWSAMDATDRAKPWQGVIDRMAKESASLKGFAVVLVAGALLAFRVTREAGAFLVAVVPMLALFLLDSYYLGMERGLRQAFRCDMEGNYNPTPLAPHTGRSSSWGQFAHLVREGATRPIIITFYATLILLALAVGVLAGIDSAWKDASSMHLPRPADTTGEITSGPAASAWSGYGY